MSKFAIACKITSVILAVALIAKDTSHLPDRYIMRGLAQGSCLLVGCLGIFRFASVPLIRRNQLFFIFIFITFVSSAFSNYFGYAMMQVISFFSIITFSVVAVEINLYNSKVRETFFKTITICYTIVCIISIGALLSMPKLVFQTNIAGGYRFSGLFGRPGSMGTAAGILVGLSLFGTFRFKHFNIAIKCISIVSAIICLIYTGARTFWIAGIISITIVQLIYYKKRFVYFGILLFFFILTVLFYNALEFEIRKEDRDKIIRTESIKNLTGRFLLWTEALKKFKKRPILGYGFGVGGAENLIGSKSYIPSKMPTLHSGYIQALVDSGIFGGLFYSFIIVFAIYKIIRYDLYKRYGAECFILIFFTISNIAESVIFTGAKFQSAFYWYTAVFAFSLERMSKKTAQKEPIRQPKGCF